MKIKVSELASVIGASFNSLISDPALQVSEVITDSRSLLYAPETVFFALSGITDTGNNYVTRLYRSGVRCFVTGKDFDTHNFAGANILKVESPLKALQRLGEYRRSLFACPVVAITGSRGKTITKEMLCATVSDSVKMADSPRSWNSQIGVPLALCAMDSDADLAVVEAGISAPGEMQTLERIIRPTAGIFTGLTDEHSRNFSDRRQHLEEKLKLFTDCPLVVTLEEYGAEVAAHCPQSKVITTRDRQGMCRALLEALGIPEAASPVGTDTVSTRIDITDTSRGNVVAYDRYSCTCEGIITALDIVRRRISGAKDIVTVIGDLQNVCPREADKVYHKLGDALFSYGVTHVITVGEEAARQTSAWQHPFKVQSYADVDALTADAPFDTVYNQCIYINTNDKEASARLYRLLCSNRNITKMEINLDSLAHNFNVYRSMLPASTGLVGMIKASGYGCGSVEVARTLQSLGADMVAVAVVDEGVELRRNGVTLPILVLDPWCDNMSSIFAYCLEPTVIEPSEQMIMQIDEAARMHNVSEARVHLKLDTGMHRVGLSEEEIAPFVKMLERYPRIRIASVFSHLATADCLDLDDYTQMQLNSFDRMSSLLRQALPYPVRRHVLNTAGIVRYGQKYKYEMARLGIGLYGISPLPQGFEGGMLKPVASLYTRIINIKHYPKGTCVGYGCKGRLDRDSVIATLPIGYADGIDRHLGNGHACFMVDGIECPTVGNICMDLCMIDITQVGIPRSMQVEIFGPHMPIEHLAEALDTIPYEVLATVSPRVQRVYYKE